VASAELGALERGEGGRHGRHEGEADPHPAHEHRHRQAEDRRVRADQPERDRREGRHHHAGERQRAATPTVAELPRERHDERHPEALRRRQQAGVDDALAADLLPVERQQDHRAEQRSAQAEHRERGRREGGAPVEAQVEQRARDAQRVHHEGGDQREAAQTQQVVARLASMSNSQS
jgi:hypothetical protein